MLIQHAGKKEAYLLIRLPGLIFHSVRDTCPIAIKKKGSTWLDLTTPTTGTYGLKLLAAGMQLIDRLR